MGDETESMRKVNEELEKLKKVLDSKKENREKRKEILMLIIANLETWNETSSNERINRAEGYYSYIASYRLEDLIEERNWFVGVLLSAAILEDVGKRKLKRAFKGKIDSEKIEIQIGSN